MRQSDKVGQILAAVATGDMEPTPSVTVTARSDKTVVSQTTYSIRYLIMRSTSSKRGREDPRLLARLIGTTNR